ncbi:hypothetical protein [Bradyrhizobium sp. CCBAU 051011]|uniref:hypothetical protein n=1 Tax=Bradyrhizobium sp. CCBAU 051011 TaxID=858422 RepID=UPI001FEFB408|nr:hypothetical protein [Bradyrhizobium sp. CCBAU 051011]
MGKRSNFERREADFYPTPRAAVVPLIPYLRGVRSFAEPCAGDGDLVRHLQGFGLRCVYAGDIHTGQDALKFDHYGAADAIITDPPYNRPVMHVLIEHFQRIAPTWLLLESDWASTRQASPFMASCSDIVAIGRVKWIEGSKHTGKDNHAWYRFNARHNGGPVFHCRSGDTVTPIRRTGICEQCRKAYEPQRSSSRFCSQACKQSAYRSRLSGTPAVTASSGLFRYVQRAEVPGYTAEGWEPLPALDGTDHGEYSLLMRRRVEQG